MVVRIQDNLTVPPPFFCIRNGNDRKLATFGSPVEIRGNKLTSGTISGLKFKSTSTGKEMGFITYSNNVIAPSFSPAYTPTNSLLLKDKNGTVVMALQQTGIWTTSGILEGQ